MRVIYFSQDYSPHDHRFLTALAQTRHKVFFLRLEGEAQTSERRPIPETVEQVQWEGGRTPFRWTDVPSRALDLRRVIDGIKPDLIHAGPIQTCAFLAILSGFRPVLTMSWGFDLMQDAGRNAWWTWVTGYTLRRSTFFTSDANVTRDRAVALGMDPDRTVVFPWGVDLTEFAPAGGRASHRPKVGGPRRGRASTPERAAVPRASLVLFCNRSWERRYGVDVLAQAFVRALRKNPKMELILLGDGSQAQAIRQILSDGGAISRVLLGGRVPHPDLPRWYHMADVFVSPSHVDGSSVSLMEALACGVPALVSDIPANREWIQDGVNGWLFRDGDVDGLADRIVALAGHRDQLRTLGRAARGAAEQKADWRRNFRVLMRAYEETVRYN